MRKLLRKITIILALAGIIVEIYFSDKIIDTLDNIGAYFLVCIMLIGYQDDANFIEQLSKDDRYQNIIWRLALRGAKNVDLLAMALLIIQIGFSI